MPFQVEQLLEGKGPLVTVSKDDTLKHALSLMLEYDYSQLPVTHSNGDFDIADGMITYEGIIRGIRNFNLGIEALKVKDVMIKIFTCNGDDDLFDILDRLKETNAALVLNKDFPVIEGIVTSYDTTEYFRTRTEDLMRVEDVESTIRELIKEAYTTITIIQEDDIVDTEKMEKAAKAVSYGRPKTFNELSLAEYINLLTYTETWGFFESIFDLPVESVKGLLHSVRETRNLLAHFRGDLSAEERDRLKFAVEWITRCQEDYQKEKEHKKLNLLMGKLKQANPEIDSSNQKEAELVPEEATLGGATADFVVTESIRGGGRYAPLADWLQSQPGRNDNMPLTFNQIEEIIGSDLPPSAREHRAWWANDSVGHTHSQLWLDAGWRTTYVNLSEGRITFSRIREREKAYIEFFGNLLNDLRGSGNFSIRDISPDGASWVVIQKIPRLGQTFASYVASFSRTKKLRIELYLDLLDKDQTKLAFEKLLEKKPEFESQLGVLEWERLDNRRASRIALYKDGQITEEDKLPELRKWAVDTMYKLYNTTVEPVEKVIREIKKQG